MTQHGGREPGATARLRLRATGPGDLDYVLGAEQHPDNREWLLAWSPAQHRAALADPALRHLLAEAAGAPVGFAILAGLDSPHRSIECRRVVVTEKGRGLGRALLREVMALAFGELGAHRLWLDTQTRNARALALYESEGFRREGVLRECWRENDAWQSLVVLSLLEGEYRDAIRR